MLNDIFYIIDSKTNINKYLIYKLKIKYNMRKFNDYVNYSQEMTAEDLWGELIDNGIATEKELQLITNINGYSIKTLNDVLYVRTGYNDWDQYNSEFGDGEDEYEDDDEDEEEDENEDENENDD